MALYCHSMAVDLWKNNHSQFRWWNSQVSNEVFRLQRPPLQKVYIITDLSNNCYGSRSFPPEYKLRPGAFAASVVFNSLAIHSPFAPPRQRDFWPLRLQLLNGSGVVMVVDPSSSEQKKNYHSHCGQGILIQVDAVFCSDYISRFGLLLQLGFADLCSFDGDEPCVWKVDVIHFRLTISADTLKLVLSILIHFHITFHAYHFTFPSIVTSTAGASTGIPSSFLIIPHFSIFEASSTVLIRNARAYAWKRCIELQCLFALNFQCNFLMRLGVFGSGTEWLDLPCHGCHVGGQGAEAGYCFGLLPQSTDYGGVSLLLWIHQGWWKNLIHSTP